MMENRSNRPAAAGAGNDSVGILGLNERLGLIGLIEEGMKTGASESPIVADLFNNLWELVGKTAKGGKVDRLKPEKSQNGFRVLEINSQSGENLGRLNMLYLKKPVACYYLVYVEVAAPYRKKGLGNLVLQHYKNFLDEKSAVGLLDNIIPESDPTYYIYIKHGWRPIESIIGRNSLGDDDHYMVYIPPRFKNRDLADSLLRLVHHVKRRRAVIDMRDNEVMVKQTIDEFKDLYAALLIYFDADIKAGRANPLMRFMFTRYVTKLISFRRRIGELLGYTGGESLEQINLTPEVASLPIQSYAPRELTGESTLAFGEELENMLPGDLRDKPARSIEALPDYMRPSLAFWLQENQKPVGYKLTLGDLMDIGFDPTRLKEINIDGQDCIFERVQARRLNDLKLNKKLLEGSAETLAGRTAAKARMEINPPMLAISNKGNAYVLRKKVEGIHWEEAVAQLQSNPALKDLNASMRFDRLVKSTAAKSYAAMAKILEMDVGEVRDLLTCFVSWDLAANRPRVVVDMAGNYLETVWMA